MRYRDDRSETTEHGQTLWFADWMGGPTLSKVESCHCEDGKSRTAFISGEPDTWFSVPAYVHHKSKRVRGYITSGENGYTFIETNSPTPTITP